MTSEVESTVDPGVSKPEEGPRVQAPVERRLCRVSETQSYGRYRVFGLEDPDGPTPLPGQFYMLTGDRGWGSAVDQRPYLPRAFSVCRVREQRLDFLLEHVGPGTERLCQLETGDGVQVLGPLGIGFSAPADLGADGALLVAGGIGVAPIVIWAEQLAAGGLAPTTVVGFRSTEYTAAAELIPGHVELATDDGSEGHAGFVTELLQGKLDASGSKPAVYACGPPQMLEAVRRVCIERNVVGQLALESGMACGFGACFGCVVRTNDGYRRLCVDGPVVAASDLHDAWE